MNRAILTKSLKIGMQLMLLLALAYFGFHPNHVDVAYAAQTSTSDACGQVLADAEAKFLASLAADGSVPETPEAQAAAAEYIRLSELCYKEVEAQNAAGALQNETPTFIDNGGVLFGSESFGEFLPDGRKWGASTPGTPGGFVTYSFMGNNISLSQEGYGNSVAITSLPSYNACFLTEIRSAFAAWQAYANIKFVEVPDNGAPFDATGAVGDIRIAAHYFDGASRVLAHGYYPPPNGTSAAGDVHFDSSENWACEPGPGKIDIGLVALHEIGHTLGLDHQTSPPIAVMNPTYNASLSALQSDDINGATAIYGAAPLSAPIATNDNFADAIAVSSLPYEDTTDTTQASTQAPDEKGIDFACNSSVPEDNHTLFLGHKTVWYKYSPASTGPISLDTLGTNYDTYIIVWTAPNPATATLNDLTFVACDDDTRSGDNTSQMTFNVTSGVTYYIQIAQYNGYYFNGTRTTATGGTLNFHMGSPSPVGIYDDTDVNWFREGSWATLNTSGPYNNTLHYTFTTGDSAWFPFTGTQFILTYTRDTNRANYDVYVDGTQVARINANGSFQWQTTYNSPVFPSGSHVVEFVNAGGGGNVMDLDKIQILATSAPGNGTYDDTYFNWAYSGPWAMLNTGGPSSGTLHYTFATENSAAFTFSGTQFILSYTQDTNRASYDVYVDGGQIARINANGTFQWQKKYTSPIFPDDTHVVEFINIGGGGGVMDVDAIEIRNTPAPGAGAYDDGHPNWAYSGSWATLNTSGPYSSTLHYTFNVGDSAFFTFSGTQFILTYTQDTNRGLYDVYVDGNKVTTINATGSFLWKRKYLSPTFTNGTHVVEFVNAGGGGNIMDIDAIEIRNSAAPGAGTYEDSNSNWAYSGSWATLNNANATNGTLHYTLTVQDSASFIFSGTQFILTYTRDTNRANYDVYVDGKQVARINANGSFQWQTTYTSPIFPSGTHVVEFRNAGGGGGVMDVDAIQILATAAPGFGTYDDSTLNWAYSGSWATLNTTGPANGTLHYTFTAQDSASFTFSGTQFTLTYTQDTNRGSYNVLVDGLQVARINANGSFLWQKTYTSPIFPSGTHVVEFRNVGGGGGVMDVDTIQILTTAAPGAGTYDDNNPNWAYSGSWIPLTINGASSNSLHYTSTAWDSASFTFSGTRFTLTYTQDTNRGLYDVYVDGEWKARINANGSFQWQRTYTSSTFAAGTHLVQFKLIPGAGNIMDVDAITIN